VIITSNLRLAAAPGNVLLRAGQAGLSKDSVVNVSQVLTLDKGRLLERIGRVPGDGMAEVEDGLRRVMGL
jgi:mRNA interferase MazF